MPRVIFYSPHPDDETLSAGLALTRWLAAGFDVHLVSMNRGGVTPASVKLDGSGVCGWHGYTHDPSREGYTVPSVTQIASARLLETRSALGQMATITPDAGVTPGALYHHEGNLPDGFGGPYGLPPTAAGIDAAKTVIAQFVADYPNSFHYTMSPTDDHPDHAACGEALRQLKNVDPTLANARFFVSKLYWDYTQNLDVAAQPGLAWYSAGPRKAEYDALLRGRVIGCFKAWNPAAGSFGIGYHQVVNQFNNCFSTSVNISNLWHA